MSIFKKAENTMAVAKVGILGFAGAGKTRTATEMAIGLHKAIGSKRPVAFMDTETGSDFMLPLFKKAGIAAIISKSRAFKDLLPGLKEAQGEADIIIIDSITHFWEDIVQSFIERKKEALHTKAYRMSFQDWGIVKPMWKEFSTFFVNSPLHIIICGRAGFEYDYFENDEQKMELYKTGTKMKVENEFGFEPSLLIEMERVKNPEATEEYRQAKTKDAKAKAVKKMQIEREFVRVATVLKDRSDILDGQTFINPSYAEFAPHWASLNIGGVHHPLEAGNSTELFDQEGGQPEWKKEAERKEIALEEVKAMWTMHGIDGRSADSKKQMIEDMEACFGTRSWAAIEKMNLSEVQSGFAKLKGKYEPKHQGTQKSPVDEIVEYIADIENVKHLENYMKKIGSAVETFTGEEKVHIQRAHDERKSALTEGGV